MLQIWILMVSVKKKIGPYSWESQPQVATFQPKLLEKSYSSEFLWSEKKNEEEYSYIYCQRELWLNVNRGNLW